MNLHRYYGEESAIESALLRVRWPVLLTSVLDIPLLERLKSAYNPLVVYRDIINGADADNAQVDPLVLGQHTIDAVRDARHVVDVVQGYNEVLNSSNTSWQAQREWSYMSRCHDAGLKVLVATIPVGNIDPSAFTLPNMQRLVRDCDWFGYGGYVRPGACDIDDVPYYLKRPVEMWAPFVESIGLMPMELFLSKIMLRETGTYHGWRGAFAPEQYGDLLVTIDQWARGEGIPYTSPFILSGFDPWPATFEFIHDDVVLDRLASYANTLPERAPGPTAPTVINSGSNDQPHPNSDQNEEISVEPGLPNFEDVIDEYIRQHPNVRVVGDYGQFAEDFGFQPALSDGNYGLITAFHDKAVTGVWQAGFIPFQ